MNFYTCLGMYLGEKWEIELVGSGLDLVSLLATFKMAEYNVQIFFTSI